MDRFESLLYIPADVLSAANALFGFDRLEKLEDLYSRGRCV